MDEEPENSQHDQPPMFDWSTAHDMMNRIGPDKALVLGLSMVSEQLDYLTRMVQDG